MNKWTATGCLFFALLSLISAQKSPFSLLIRPVYKGQALVLNQTIQLENGHSLVIEKLQCYLGKFLFGHNGQWIPADENLYYLFDAEEEATHRIAWPKMAGADSLCFWLGVDSLTTAAGAMSGDLDPTKGLFWTWQSGYINVKIEGHCTRSSAKQGFFECHLGGYLPPYAAVNRVCLSIPVSQKESERVLEWDFSSFFSEVNWVKSPMIMSPGKEAQRLSAVLSQSFRWYAP